MVIKIGDLVKFSNINNTEVFYRLVMKNNIGLNTLVVNDDIKSI